MTSLNTLLRSDLKVRRPLKLSEFSEAFEDDYLSVWLNPSVDFYERWEQLAALETETQERLAEILSQERDAGESPVDFINEISELTEAYTHAADPVLADLWDCTPEAVAAIREHSGRLLQWCVAESFKMIRDYGGLRKKN